MPMINELQLLFKGYLEANRFESQPSGLYQPINYFMSLGGKRIRPILTLIGYDLFAPAVEKALPLAYAMELFHNFTLVHDDIMDQAPIRRGQPTIHQQYGINTAILSGDVMLIHVYDYLLEAGFEHQFPALLSTFNRVAVEVCKGQQYDMDFENRKDVSIPEYLRMIELKTAALLGGCLEVGAVAAEASQKDIQLLAIFGRHLGIAFQLQDDILDAFGDPEKFGKKQGGDIVQNKKTFLVLKAMEVADIPTGNRLKDLMENPTIAENEKVREVLDIFQHLKIAELASSVKDQYQASAFKALTAVNAPEDKKDALKNLAFQLMAREN